MQSMKRALASLVAGAFLVAVPAARGAEGQGADPTNTRSARLLAAETARHAPALQERWAAASQRVKTRLAEVARSSRSTKKRVGEAGARAVGHQARLDRFAHKNRLLGPVATASRTPLSTPGAPLVLKWVAGAALGMLVVQVLPVWPLAKACLILGSLVAGAVFVPPAYDAWVAEKARTFGEAGATAPSGPTDWWRAYLVALKAHKAHTMPYLQIWRDKGLTLVQSGLKSLGGALGKPAQAAATGSTAATGGS
ncbi:MAG: hypothetical protein IPG96_02190 [Proteobacteria bacterium]|nr:hypothetical protein [Pseudomonadota bacterium]